jgi:hypothetical protein
VSGPGWHQKIDHRLRALVEAPAADPAQRVTVFVRSGADPGRLQELGLSPGTRAGEVSAGSIALGDVERLAAAPDVAYVELMRAIPIDRPA